MAAKPITIAILAMGGEGGGVLADWLVSLAEEGGYYAQATSVPGVAQRTGSTIYYLEMFPEEAARAAGQEPVLALMPVPGELDIVIASELMEAGRAIQRGLVTPDRTTLIASTHRVYSMTERTAAGDARVDGATLVEAGRAAAKNFVQADFAAIAREADSVISAALFGALAGTGRLPFERSQFEEAIRRGGVGVDASLRAFGAGWNGEPGEETQAGPAPVLQAGVERLTDYQDARYAAEYLEMLEPIRASGGHPAVMEETARYLALWMSYEDAIRVADLKTRAARFDRVHRESRAVAGQLVQINDYVYPRVGELADVLPAGIGEWLLRTGWARRMVERFTRHGKIVETTSLGGFLRLYAVAALRPWRRKSLRYKREHLRIREWLAVVREVAAENCALAREVAECPRLIKGYGDTHAGGMRKFDRLMAALPRLRGMDDGARRLKELREIALADETGEKLEEALGRAPDTAARQLPEGLAEKSGS
jgi:indolepyruvate ferredoxin oxidoreductase beta subunit